MTLMNKSVPFAKLLPNLVTLTGLVVGVSSIRFAIDGNWEKAVFCILIATIIDGLDGRVARFLNATSHFGAELDSLCDFVNFGLCPAILIYLWSLQQYEYKIISWSAILLFVVCMAIRLARFNTAIVESSDVKKDNRFLIGVPAPSGALLALVPMIIDFKISFLIPDFTVRNCTLLIDLYIIFIALLLPSKVPTLSLNKIRIKANYLSIVMMLSAIFIIALFIYPWYVLPLLAVFYLLSILICVYIINNPKGDINESHYE